MVLRFYVLLWHAKIKDRKVVRAVSTEFNFILLIILFGINFMHFCFLATVSIIYLWCCRIGTLIMVVRSFRKKVSRSPWSTYTMSMLNRARTKWTDSNVYIWLLLSMFSILVYAANLVFKKDIGFNPLHATHTKWGFTSRLCLFKFDMVIKHVSRNMTFLYSLCIRGIYENISERWQTSIWNWIEYCVENRD